MLPSFCGNCGAPNPAPDSVCRTCNAPLLAPPGAGVAVWRMGKVSESLLQPFLVGLSKRLGVRTVLQPSLLDEQVAYRRGWNGLSANVFLHQVSRRRVRGSFVALGVTEANIVDRKEWNYLLAWPSRRGTRRSSASIG